MSGELRKKIAKLISEDGVLGVLGLYEQDGLAIPHLFASDPDTAHLVLEPKWPLAKTAWNLAGSLPAGASIGLVCRGCDMRALIELEKAGQLRPGAVRPIGLECSPEQATACLCETPYPPGAEPGAGEGFQKSTAVREVSLSETGTGANLATVESGIDRNIDDVPAPALDPGRFEIWREHFSRCIKCYGCRNACPLCVCPSCKLEDDAYVTKGRVPPDPLAYHLIRAMHLADRCVGCGACQESCPSGLPLLELHLAMRNALRARTGYISGTTTLSPLLTAGREGGFTGETGPLWEDTIVDKAN